MVVEDYELRGSGCLYLGDSEVYEEEQPGAYEGVFEKTGESAGEV